MQEYQKITEQLRASFKSGKTLPIEYRLNQLDRLHEMITQEQSRGVLMQALMADGKCEGDATFADLCTVEAEIAITMRNLREWARDLDVSLPIAFAMVGDSGTVKYDPLGMVLIIGTWNYPVNSTLGPLIGAIAAGCVAVIKTSEVAENTAVALAKLTPQFLDQECYRVVNGAVKEVTCLLSGNSKSSATATREWKWDHIFFTGNSQVGRIIAKAAAETLTPVTLEMGGKSPCILDGSLDEGSLMSKVFMKMSLSMVADRITCTKFLNCGQTCIAPDHVLVPESKINQLVELLKGSMGKMYGTDGDAVKSSKSFSRIVSARHFERLEKILKNTKAEVVIGGLKLADKKQLFIPPTVLVLRPKGDDLESIYADSVMQEEIFGPIVPLIPYPDRMTMLELVDFVNEREKPLSAYMFSNDAANIALFKERLYCGGMVINDAIVQFVCDTLPFGGVGNSGVGNYHGKYSFLTFSHQKAIVHRGATAEIGGSLRQPPFTDAKLKMTRMALVPSKPSVKQSWFW